MVYVIKRGDFNNVCDTGSDMIWSLLEKPKDFWGSFVKLSTTKRKNLGKKANSLPHIVAYSDDTTHFAIFSVLVSIPQFGKHKPSFNFIQQPKSKQFYYNTTLKKSCNLRITLKSLFT